MPEDLDTVPKRLRFARENSRNHTTGELTQGDVANHLNMGSAEAYGHYERGNRRISLDNLKKVAAFTGYRADWILSGEGEKEEDKKDPLQSTLDMFRLPETRARAEKSIAELKKLLEAEDTILGKD